MTYLESIEREEVLQIVDKLLIQFLKKNRLMYRLYHNRKCGVSIPLLTESDKSLPPSFILEKISRHFLNCAKDIDYYKATKFRFSREDLDLSQLWRFYVLENLHLFHSFKWRNVISSMLRAKLKINRNKGNEELEKLFAKWKILS